LRELDVHNALRDLLHSCHPKHRKAHESSEPFRDIGQSLGKLRKLLWQLLLDVPEQIHVRHLGGRRYLNLSHGKLSAAANPRSLHLAQAI
jgi:hypothetical protein